MLINHKFRIVKNNHVKTIPYERPYFSLDGKSFSCIVSQDLELSNDDSLLLQVNSGSILNVDITVKKFIEQGWTEIETQYPLLKQTRETSNEYTNNGDILTWRYFLGDDGCIKSGYIDGSNKLFFPELNVYAIEYDEKSVVVPIKYYVESGIINYRNQEYIPVTYDEEGNVNWIQKMRDGMYIKINDNKRENWKKRARVTIKLPEDIVIPFDDIALGKYQAYVTVNNQEYDLSYRYAVDEDGNGYIERYISSDVSEDGNDYVEDNNFLSDDEGEEYYSNNIVLWDGLEHDIEEKIIPDNNGDLIILYIDSDSFINVYSSSNIIAQRLQSTPTPYYLEYDENNEPLLNEDGNKIILIDNVPYAVETVDMIDFSGLKELFVSSEKDSAYYIKMPNGRKIYFKKEGENTFSLLLDGKIKYNLIQKERVVYNNVEYYKDLDVIDNTQPDEEYDEVYDDDADYEHVNYWSNKTIFNYFLISTTPKFLLNVIDKTEPNIYYCKLYNDSNNHNAIHKKDYMQWVYNDIFGNISKYIFKLEPEPFFYDKTSDYNIQEIFGLDASGTEGIVDTIPSVVLQKYVSEMTVPVSLCTLHGTNLNQEIDVKNTFFEEQSRNSVNRIVDMEKDIYYPMVIKNDELVDATEVDFFIHLRTRNDDWEIENDVLAEVEDIYGRSFINGTTTNSKAENGKTEFDLRYKNTSWNLFDYYPEFCDTIKRNRADDTMKYKYYQPSDLLGFFDFSDDDVFYQKSKIGKTFLRLSFYDSKDPQKQSLLGTSSVFLDSNTLFGKFIDKMANTDSLITYKNPKTWIGSSKSISCEREPISVNINNPQIGFIDFDNNVYKLYDTFNKDGVNIEFTTDEEIAEEFLGVLTGPKDFLDEDYRMDSTIKINSKLTTNSSAEGFYNYIFREYSYGLHERTIYLRIQLNHAGHGQVIDLIQPSYKDHLGITHIMSLDEMIMGKVITEKDEDGRDVPVKTINPIKRGVNLKELYDMMYIPVKVKYDYTLKKFCWYLPKEMVKHDENKIKFNLYEIKINKDLSYREAPKKTEKENENTEP